MNSGRACPHCGAALSSTVLNCPSCGERLHVLRPRTLESSPRPSQPAQGALGRKAATAGGLAYILWKLKFFLFLILGKAKFLLLGLSKISTLASMFVTAWAYSGRQGWPFAAGLVLSIYIHEMGHVQALARYGVRASAPVFIPFVGAFIRLQQNFGSRAQDARVGLAGPLWGWGAAVLSEALGHVFNWPLGYALGRLGAMINLFNLIPVWQLDGGRAIGALNRSQRWLLLMVVALAWLWTQNGLLIFIGAGCLFKAMSRRAPEEPDQGVLMLFVFLVGILSVMSVRPLV